MTSVSYEPMDIDSSNNSCNAMDISYNDFVFERDVQTPETVLHSTFEKRKTTSLVPENTCCQVVKKFHIDMTTLRTKRCSFVCDHVHAILFFTILFISIFSIIVDNSKCYHEFDINSLNKSLTSKIYGQPEAVGAFVQALEINATSKILFLYGGTGVGKTLSISIFLDILQNYTNIYHYTMPSFVEKFSMDLNIGFHLCQKWIIIVDDLTAKDDQIVSIVSTVVEKTESFKKNVTIILIYNCNEDSKSFSGNCDSSFIIELKQAFKDVRAIKTFIRYIPLTEQILRKCIEMELKHKSKRNMDIGKIMKYFDVKQDGCKGVYKKVQAL